MIHTFIVVPKICLELRPDSLMILQS